MAVDIEIPVEINEYREKIVGGMTARQLIGGLCAVALGVGSYFLCTKTLKLSVSSAGYVVMLLTALPLAIGFLTIDGRPFEEYLGLMLRHILGRHRMRLDITIPTDRSETCAVKQKKGKRDRRLEGEVFVIDKKAGARRRSRTAKAIKAAKKEYRREKRRYKKAAKKGGRT